MNSNVEQFRKLHQQPEPLLIGNVWSAQSAKVFEKQNYKAVGTSSAAVAEALGYADGEQMSFEEYFAVINRIKASVNLPLTVDLEGGYGKTEEQIVKNIQQLATIGIVGINIEDSVVDQNGRRIVDAEPFAKKLKSIVRKLKDLNIDLFINVRCDAFLLGLNDARNEAIKRTALYDKTGVDGIFLPCITSEDDIRATVGGTSLPVNVMCMPNLPDFKVLTSLGVKRISIGPFLNMAVYKKMEELSAEIVNKQSFSSLF